MARDVIEGRVRWINGDAPSYDRMGQLRRFDSTGRHYIEIDIEVTDGGSDRVMASAHEWLRSLTEET